ncbi:VOC family protein [Nocardia sp. CA-119907]|uniref:VOC family protein n=1 Tax=Nocardia sp. CA-119907 TaxID=3239973 RepID=UPI003D9661F0
MFLSRSSISTEFTDRTIADIEFMQALPGEWNRQTSRGTVGGGPRRHVCGETRRDLTMTEIRPDTDYLDHSVVINRDYVTVWDAYERLGFFLSPESRHKVTVSDDGEMVPSMTGNRCAYFGESYIELIGIVDDSCPDPWGVLPLIDGKYEGLRGVSFGFGSSESALQRLRDADLESGAGITELQRPVDTEDGSRLLRARVVHVARSRTPEGIMHISEHLTPEYAHQPRYLHHPNGAQSLDAILLAVPDSKLESYVDRYATILGRQPIVDGERRRFQLRAGAIEILAGSALQSVLPGHAAPVLPFFAGQAVNVPSIDNARDLIEDNGLTAIDCPEGFFVDVEGSAVIFRQAA